MMLNDRFSIKKGQLLAQENLPLDLGMVPQTDLVMPGAYDAVLENPEAGVGTEFIDF